MATLEFISSLHAECDWPVQYSWVRKEGRAGEVESLQKAKAVLSGSDYSLIQTVKAHVRSQQDPKGPGHPEPIMGGACAECAKHAPYLNRKDQCVCFATDIMGTFADDATKELTTRSKYGFEAVNTGTERLVEGWMWHCHPITSAAGVRRDEKKVQVLFWQFLAVSA